MSSIPEALPTPRRQIRRAETQSRPIVDKDVVIELVVAIIVAWLVLALTYFFAGGGGGMGIVSWWNTAVHLPPLFVQTVDAHTGLGILL